MPAAARMAGDQGAAATNVFGQALMLLSIHLMRGAGVH